MITFNFLNLPFVTRTEYYKSASTKTFKRKKNDSLNPQNRAVVISRLVNTFKVGGKCQNLAPRKKEQKIKLF